MPYKDKINILYITDYNNNQYDLNFTYIYRKLRTNKNINLITYKWEYNKDMLFQLYFDLSKYIYVNDIDVVITWGLASYFVYSIKKPYKVLINPVLTNIQISNYQNIDGFDNFKSFQKNIIDKNLIDNSPENIMVFCSSLDEKLGTNSNFIASKLFDNSALLRNDILNNEKHQISEKSMRNIIDCMINELSKDMTYYILLNKE